MFSEIGSLHLLHLSTPPCFNFLLFLNYLRFCERYIILMVINMGKSLFTFWIETAAARRSAFSLNGISLSFASMTSRGNWHSLFRSLHCCYKIQKKNNSPLSKEAIDKLSSCFTYIGEAGVWKGSWWCSSLRPCRISTRKWAQSFVLPLYQFIQPFFPLHQPPAPPTISGGSWWHDSCHVNIRNIWDNLWAAVGLDKIPSSCGVWKNFELHLDREADSS